MSNIRVDLNTPIKDGMEVVFRSPVDCSQITGLIVYYNGGSQEFMFADAHGNDVGIIDHLFAEDVVVKVILDVTTGMAFVQNADTNAYLEQRFDDIEENISPIVCDAVGDVIALSDASNKKLRGLTVYGKTTQNGTPTPDAPVELVSAGASGVINTTVCGKNLLEHNVSNHTTNGITVTVNADKSITLVGTATATTTLWFLDSLKNLMVGESYLVKDCTAVKVVENGGTSYKPINQPLVKTANMTEIKAYLQIANGTSISKTIYPMIYHASNKDVTYEPHKPVQTLTVSTPNGLPGIPVSSGGNYTDESGQQWVCDEIDFARGVYVQRIFEFNNFAEYIDSNLQIAGYKIYKQLADTRAKSNNKSAALCSHTTNKEWSNAANPHYYTSGANGWVFLPETVEVDTAEIKIIAERETPIETALSAEELAQYSVLHTNKPNTTVLNDSGAGMAVGYVADTKTYIDNKFTKLQNAILASGANV